LVWEEEEELVKEESSEKEECLPQSIEINAASLKELEKLVGVGPVLAQRIIDTRPYYSITDLRKVKGIGSKTLQKIIRQKCAYVADSYKKLAFVSASGGGGSKKESSINVSLPKEIASDQEFEVTISVSDLENSSYDLKVSILKISEESEQKRTISQIYDKENEKWQSSYNYLKNLFRKV